MAGIVEVLGLLPPLVVLLVAVALVMGETGVIIGLFFPVEITLIFVGFLAYLGEVPFVLALLLMIAAALVGDALALRSGRKYGRRLRASRLGARVGEERWARADRVLHRLGGRSAFVARWVPFVRTLLPRLAGSAGMPYRRYAPWDFAGVVTAVGSSVVLGYLAGASYERVADQFGRATTAVLLLLIVVVALVLVGRWLGRNPQPVFALAARVARLPLLRWLSQRYGELFARLARRLGAGWALVLNLLVGVALMFALGLGLSWLVRLVVDHSDLSEVDETIGSWFADHRTEPVVAAAEIVTRLLRGSVLIAVVAVVAVVLAIRTRAWRNDLLGIFGTAGAFVPLVILAAVAELAGGDAADPIPTPARPGPPTASAGGFGDACEPYWYLCSTQTAVSTAALCTLVWLLTRQARWPRAVAGWTVAVIGIVVLSSARLYLGSSTVSETVTAVLLGVLWPAMFMVAWRVRDRSVSRAPAEASVGGPARSHPSQEPH